MKTKSIFVPGLVASCIFVLFLSCSKNEDESYSEHATDASSSSQISTKPDSEAGTPPSVAVKPVAQDTETFVDLRDVLSSWRAGDKERATRQFIKVNWDHPEVFANVPVLNISQQDFMASSQTQQIQFMQDTKDLAVDLHKLGLHILSIGEASLASGDKATSKKYYESVLKCGQSIASNDYYELILLTAKNLIKAAEVKLSQLEAS